MDGDGLDAAVDTVANGGAGALVLLVVLVVVLVVGPPVVGELIASLRRGRE